MTGNSYYQLDVETRMPNIDVPGERKVSDLALAPEESRMEVQTMVPEAETVTPMRRASRSTKVNVERPSAAVAASTAVSSIPPATVYGNDVRDDSGLLLDPLLQSDVETTTPNNDVPVEGKVSDLALAPEESKMEVQMTVPEAETVTPMRRESRSTKVNVERPSWLPEGWGFERKVRTNGATAGTIDRYYYEPVTGAQFRSKAEVLYFLETGAKRKKANTGAGSDAILAETPNKKKSASKKEKEKSSEFYFDSANPPESVCWTPTDSRANTWAASVNGNTVPDSVKQQWDTVYSIVANLPPRNT